MALAAQALPAFGAPPPAEMPAPEVAAEGWNRRFFKALRKSCLGQGLASGSRV